MQVTRYKQRQQQRIHFDARPQGDPAGLQRFLAAGGQRLVQVVVYLNDLEAGQGGGTHFHHPLLKGLTVQVRPCRLRCLGGAGGPGRLSAHSATLQRLQLRHGGAVTTCLCPAGCALLRPLYPLCSRARATPSSSSPPSKTAALTSAWPTPGCQSSTARRVGLHAESRPACRRWQAHKQPVHPHRMLPRLCAQKWIANTWACQRAVPAAVTHLPPPEGAQR